MRAAKWAAMALSCCKLRSSRGISAVVLAALIAAAGLAACADTEEDHTLAELDVLELGASHERPLAHAPPAPTAAAESESDGFAQLLERRLARDEVLPEDAIVSASELALDHSLALARTLLSADGGVPTAAWAAEDAATPDAGSR